MVDGNGTGSAGGQEENPNPGNGGKSGSGTSEGDPGEKGVDYYRSDAEKARAERDKAKAERNELRNKLESIEAKMADDQKSKEAGGDLSKQLELAQAKLSALEGELQSERKGRRTEKIEAAVLSKIPQEKHRLARTLLKSHASSLDDGKTEADAVIEESIGFLQDLAPDMFKPDTGTKGGKKSRSGEPVLPIEGEPPNPGLGKGLASVRKKHQALLR